MNEPKHFLWGCRYAGEKGLVTASSGNLSVCDKERQTMIISASGSWLEDACKPVLVDMNTGKSWHIGSIPSTECPIHMEIYRRMPWAGAVLHFQSPYATAFACIEPLLTSRPDLCIIPEVPYYIGRPLFVSYHKPGSDALVKELRKACLEHPDSDTEKCHLIFLVNHGAISIGVDTEEAVKIALFAEFACQIAYINRTAQLRTSTLPE